jgi:hypothetical protein
VKKRTSEKEPISKKERNSKKALIQKWDLLGEIEKNGRKIKLEYDTEVEEEITAYSWFGTKVKVVLFLHVANEEEKNGFCDEMKKVKISEDGEEDGVAIATLMWVTCSPISGLDNKVLI